MALLINSTAVIYLNLFDKRFNKTDTNPWHKDFYNNNNYKCQYPQKESSSVAHLVEELGKPIVQVWCKVQQMIRWSGNLVRISESEKACFQMLTETKYAIWCRNMFREWIPKSRNSNWKGTSPSMSFNFGIRQQVKTRWTELKKAWKIDMKVLQKKEFDTWNQ